MSVPVEIARREDQVEVRARERYIREKAEFNTRMAARQAKEAETGKKTGGKNPAPVILLADTGYFSEQNVKACIGAEVEPLISTIPAGESASVNLHPCRQTPRRSRR